MEIVCEMARVFRLICLEQHIISNLLVIKDMHMGNSLMEIVCEMGRAFQGMLNAPLVISSSPSPGRSACANEEWSSPGGWIVRLDRFE
jgi:hypothetical protein